MKLTIDSEQEVDGRWPAEVRELPGVLAYGRSQEAAVARVQALALRVLAVHLEHGEGAVDGLSIVLHSDRNLHAPRPHGCFPCIRPDTHR